MLPSPLNEPTLRDDLPRYPALLQLLRVIAGAVQVGPASLYNAFTQQLRTDNLLPRDREPCWADDVVRLGLTPGYYLGRLAGSYRSLPVYEVACCPPGGLTQEQLDLLVSLTPSRAYTLYNLTPCQLQTTLLGLTSSQLQTLTASLTPAQFPVMVDELTVPQLTELVGTLTPGQLSQLTENLTATQFQTLTRTFTPAQLIPLLDLTNDELQTLLRYPPNQMSTLNEMLTQTQLRTLLRLTRQQQRTITDLTFRQLQTLLRTPFTPYLTSSLSLTELPTLIDYLTPDELTKLTNRLTIEQITKLTKTFTQEQVRKIVTSLTPDQIALLLSSSTPEQMLNLIQLPTNIITQEVASSTPNDLQTLLNAVPVVGLTGSTVGQISLTYTGTQTIVTHVECIAGVLSVTTKDFTWINGMLTSVV